MQTADWLRTIVFSGLKKKWDHCCYVLICIGKNNGQSAVCVLRWLVFETHIWHEQMGNNVKFVLVILTYSEVVLNRKKSNK